jgi:hypothetical protein
MMRRRKIRNSPDRSQDRKGRNRASSKWLLIVLTPVLIEAVRMLPDLIRVLNADGPT